MLATLRERAIIQTQAAAEAGESAAGKTAALHAEMQYKQELKVSGRHWHPVHRGRLLSCTLLTCNCCSSTLQVAFLDITGSVNTDADAPL